MHANAVFLLGLGLLLVVGRGFGYAVPEDGAEGKRNDGEDETLGRSDDLNRLELKDDETLRDEDSLDQASRSAAAAAAAAGRSWYKGSAAGAAAASRAAAAAAAAAARMANKRAAAAAAAASGGGSFGPWPSSLGIGISSAARFGLRDDEMYRADNEINRVAALKYMDDESDSGMRASDYDEMMRNGEEDDFIGVVNEDPSLELYYRYLSDPLRQVEEEIQSLDEVVIQEPDSYSKKVLESLRESSPQTYYRLLKNAIRSDPSGPLSRGAAAAAAAASGWRSAAAAAAAAGRRRAAAAAAAAAARSAAAAAAAASGWRSPARSAAAAAAAAGRRSPISPIPASYRFAPSRSSAAAAAAAGRRSLAARSAAAAAAAASRRSAAAAGAASGWRSFE